MSALRNKIVVCTGTRGFVGRHLLSRLISEGARVVAVERTPGPSVEGVETIVCDLSALTQQAWENAGIDKIDIVFHLAAYTPKSAADGDNATATLKDNILATAALLQSLPDRVERFVFSSTLDVYGALSEEVELSERTPTQPVNLYGASKLYCENLVRAWAQERKCTYAVLRYGHLFGPGEERYKKLIPLTIQAVLQGRSPVVYGKGQALRDFLYIADAVEATIRAANADNSIPALNIVSGTSVSIADVARTIVGLGNPQLSVEFQSEKLDSKGIRFDNSLMWQLLGKWQLVSLQQGLQNEIDFVKRASL